MMMRMKVRQLQMMRKLRQERKLELRNTRARHALIGNASLTEADDDSVDVVLDEDGCVVAYGDDQRPSPEILAVLQAQVQLHESQDSPTAEQESLRRGEPRPLAMDADDSTNRGSSSAP